MISKCLLLVTALLAGEFHAPFAPFRQDAIWRAAFSADGFDAGVALFQLGLLHFLLFGA